jgi:hypothetical protein
MGDDYVDKVGGLKFISIVSLTSFQLKEYKNAIVINGNRASSHFEAKH